MIDALTPAYQAGQEHTDPLEYIEVLRDRRAINERFGELQAASSTRSSSSRSRRTRRRCRSTRKGSRWRARTARAASTSSPPSTTRRFAEGVRRFIDAGEEARFVARAAAQARDHRRADRHVRHGGPGRGQLDPDDDRRRAPVARRSCSRSRSRRCGRAGSRSTRRTSGSPGAKERVKRRTPTAAGGALVGRRSAVALLAGGAARAGSRARPRARRPSCEPTSPRSSPAGRLATRGSTASSPATAAARSRTSSCSAAEDRRAPARRSSALGARVLREYRTLDAFARRLDRRAVAAAGGARCRGCRRLAPVEVVETDGRAGGRPDARHDGRRRRAGALEPGPHRRRASASPCSTPGSTRRTRTSTISTSGAGRALLNPPKVVGARASSAAPARCGVPSSAASDGHGHGTHVAGIATGTGEGTPLATDDGKYAGIAPGAELAVGKVLDRRGRRHEQRPARRDGVGGDAGRIRSGVLGRRAHREHEPRLGGAAGAASTPATTSTSSARC